MTNDSTNYNSGENLFLHGDALTEMTKISSSPKAEIYMLGDSIFKGVTFDGEKYKIRTNKNNEELEKRFSVKIFDLSKFGATVERGFEYIRKRILPGSGKKSYAIIEYGGNDADFDWKAISENPDCEHLPKTTPEKFCEIYSGIIETVRKNHMIPVAATLPPIDPVRYLNRISQGLSRENILRWLGDVQTIYRNQEFYSHIIAQVAAAENCSILDLRRPFLLRHDFEELMSDDGIHPSEKGYEILNAELEKFIEKVS